MPSASPEADGDGFWISGTKICSTGNIYADCLSWSAVEDNGTARQFFIPTGAEGVAIEDDWDGFGQKLTGSGKTVFERVRVKRADIHDAPDGVPRSLSFTAIPFTRSI
ncbi:hypothetical protein [Paracoccus benzoatiresistens]|uniref:Acyl-CoA dehydrogenase n=1 Tax=Paracoccus benzoatiresistens TaxID=2997341 RepID=A0ABT4J8I1_9RHOB|nr:hypothetical protein [Paracoccus sp. EF6]MCZ0963392.1 hypothetical protein [Paracoccus sp. EF6]